MSELIAYLDTCTGQPGQVRPVHPAACPAREAWVPLSRCTCHLRLAIPCGYCGEEYHGQCTGCHRPGEAYEYKGRHFDGLIPDRGERLCPACQEAAAAVEGVNIRVTSELRGIDYVTNTVRDAGLVAPIAAQYRPEYAGYCAAKRRR